MFMFVSVFGFVLVLMPITGVFTALVFVFVLVFVFAMVLFFLVSCSFSFRFSLTRLCLEGFLLTILKVSGLRLPGRVPPAPGGGFPRPLWHGSPA